MTDRKLLELAAKPDGNKVEWTRKPMTRADFIKGYAERSGISVDQFNRYMCALPCDCGEAICQGWQAVIIF